MGATEQGSDAASASAESRPRHAPPTAAATATPGPERLISLNAGANPLSFLGNLIESYGDVTRYRTRFGPCFLFVHPEHVQTILHRENYRRASLVKLMLGDGLLASDGPLWRSRRRLMQRDFLPAAMGGFIPIIARETTRTASEWHAAALSGEIVDITMSMTRLTLRIVVEALFSDDLPADRTAELCEAITSAITDLGKISWTIFGVPTPMSPDREARFAAAKKVIDATCLEMICRRRGMAPANRPRDVLTMLIQSDDVSGALADRHLRDEMVTMLIGGHETTALALAWTWKLLAEHPQIAAALRDEVDRESVDGVCDSQALPRFSWTRAIFQETMRLYPPVWYMARVAQEADVIAGHEIPRGACMLVSAWFTHRHKDFWSDPDRFDPTRFIDPANQPLHRYAYFPFAGGRHQCLGMHFAMMEGVMIIAQLARQFHIIPINAQQVVPAPGITLRQSPGLLANVELRNAPPPSGFELIRRGQECPPLINPMAGKNACPTFDSRRSGNLGTPPEHAEAGAA